MLQIFFQTTFWILALWIIYFKFCNFLFRTIFLHLSIIFFVILRIVLQDKLFVNCCFGQYICKLLWWIFCFQIFILDNFSGKLSFWTTFWQIVILDNFFCKLSIWTTFFCEWSLWIVFFTNCLSSCIYLKNVHLDNLFAICYCGSIILQIVLSDNFLQICKLSFWITFCNKRFRQVVSAKVVRVDQEDRVV